MEALKHGPEVKPVFLEGRGRKCVACGTARRYDYKSSGRGVRRLDEALWIEAQIHYCPNGRCPLRRKGTHPPEEWALAPAYERFGSDVIALCGALHFGEKLGRDAIAAKLQREHQVQIAPRTVNRLFDMYGALVSGAQLKDPVLIRQLERQRVLVLSLDGAEPIKGRDPVWFVRETTSGWVLAAKTMVSATTADLVELLKPVKRFAEEHHLAIVGVVSDAEDNIRAAVRTLFPGVPHQLCQIHYVKNVAKPLKRADTELRKEVKKEVRGVRPIERAIRASAAEGGLAPSDAETLLDVCEAIRSILKDGGHPPFDPPGLKLVEKLTELEQALKEMAREKGGPC